MPLDAEFSAPATRAAADQPNPTPIGASPWTLTATAGGSAPASAKIWRNMGKKGQSRMRIGVAPE